MTRPSRCFTGLLRRALPPVALILGMLGISAVHAEDQPPAAPALELQFQPDRALTAPAAFEPGKPLFPPIPVPPGHPLYVATPPPAPPAAAPEPPWLRYAVASQPGDRPLIAVVIDDYGLNRAASRRMLALPGPLTISIMTYATEPQDIAQAVRQAGHEVMMHMPMEPLARAEDPGPQALLTGLEGDDLLARVRWGLDRFDGYVGINNHMGSRFTASEAGMRVLLEEVRSRGLLFLDSMTTGRSVGRHLALELGIPFIRRDVFLDHHPGLGSVEGQLRKAEALASRQGYAVVIGHPRPDTIAALARWLPEVAARGYAIVPLTTVVQRYGDAPTARQTATAR